MDDLSTLSDNDLIIKARNGDEPAFTALVHRYDRNILSMASHYFHSSDDVKDVFQETFIKVYKGLNNFEFRSEFSTWIFRIATNVCLTHKARSKKYENVNTSSDLDDSPNVDIKSSGDEPDEQLIKKETKSKVNLAIESLAPRQKMAFLLKHIHEYKIKEIAEMMKCSEGTVKKYLFIATDKLRIKLKTI